MKLITKGNINLYDAQNLCLIFFPGEKFPKKGEVSPDAPEAEFTLEELAGGVKAEVKLKLRDKITYGSRFLPFEERYSSRRSCRLACGAAMFEAGQKMFGYAPPWGMITGVRPAKIAAEYLENGFGAEKTCAALKSEYFVSDKKAKLLTKVAENEARIINSLEDNSCSVYISIPFCPSRCSYCSFVSYSTDRLISLIPEYLERLLDDIEDSFSVIHELGMKVSSVYIGGGTPTILTPLQMKTLLEKINSSLKGKAEEFTVEGGRPDTITSEKLGILKDCGVNRISINPQTLNDKVLERIGRSHTANDFFRAYETARSVGIETINTDIIAGLPGDTFESFSVTADEIIKLCPENITCHTFCVKRSADIIDSGENIYSLTGGETPECVDYMQMRAAEAGYEPYYLYKQKNSMGNLENVGFCLPGHQGLYNVCIMEEAHTIFAVGAGSVTKLINQKTGKLKRIFMPKYPYEYLSADRDEYTAAQKRNEIINFFKENGADT